MAWCIYIHTAARGCHKSYPLLDSPDPGKTQSEVGTVLSYTAPPA